jgi:hypothetical protein
MFDMVGKKEGIAGEVGLAPEDLALDLVVGDVQDQNLIHGDLVPSVLHQGTGREFPLMVVLTEVVIAMAIHVHRSTVVTMTARMMIDIADTEKNLPGYTLLKLRNQNG